MAQWSSAVGTTGNHAFPYLFWPREIEFYGNIFASPPRVVSFLPRDGKLPPPPPTGRDFHS